MASSNRPKALAVGTFSALTVWLASAPLAAQTPPPPATVAATEQTDVEIVVTGSRIKRTEYTSAAPVQIITRERTILEGLTNQAEVIQSTSVAAGSGQINSTFTGFVVEGGPGVNTVSLRGLGAQRSLVLLNGRRLPPAGVGGQVGAVDLNILPNSIVNRVEILKDGASSIYGSDAVAGVVNVITRQRLEGGRIGATSNSAVGGGDEYQAEGGYGWVFDRGALSVSAEFYRRTELPYGDRSFLNCQRDLLTAAAAGTMPAVSGYVLPPRTLAAGDSADMIDPRTGKAKCFNTGVSGYVITYNPFAGFGVGSRTPNAPIVGLTTTAGILANNPIPGWRFIPYQERTFDDPRAQQASAISPTDRASVFVQGEWRPEMLGGGQLYTEILANRRKSSGDDFRQLFPDVSALSPITPFRFPTLGTAARYATPVILVPSNSEQKVDVIRGLAGLRGGFGSSSWSYDVYASYSRSNGDYNRDVIPEDRLIAGTATTQDGNFDDVPLCGPTAPAGCVPFTSLFTSAGLAGNFTPAEQAYFFAKDYGNTKYDQTIVEAQFTGDITDMPAGKLAAAAGVVYRKDKIDDLPGIFQRTGNSWASLTAGETKGTDALFELYTELEIPLLRGVSMVKDLTLNLSGRYSDYDSVGGASTYKAGLNWIITDWVRLRSTYGTSFRAPALYELYLSDQISFLSQTQVDPCIRYGDPDAPKNATIQRNCRADGITDPLFVGGNTSAEILTGGGLGKLSPEDSRSLSVGLVLTPPDLGLNVAIDYFDIEVNNQIGSFAGGAVGACYTSETFRSQPGFCDLFTRGTGANAGIDQIDASYRNIPTERTTGFDITTAYEKDLTFGKLSIDSQITYTKSDILELFKGRVYDFNGLVGEPKWVGSAQARFKRGDWTVAWTLNYTGPGSNQGYEGENGTVAALAGLSLGGININSAGAFVTHDLSARYEADKWSVIAGVTNLMNDAPPQVSTSDDSGGIGRIGNIPLSSQYFSGILGRTWFVTADFKF
jgi:iron complex outermembrane receptor protein